MSHFYQNVLEPVLNRPMEGLIKFLRLKRMLKQTVMSHECCVDMVCKPYTQIKDGIWRLGAIFFFLFIFIFTHNQLEINHSACRNKDCE